MLRFVVYALVLLVMSPALLLYLIGYMFVIVFLNRRQGISGTAYEPFTSRVLMHDLGLRDDVAASRLATSLPATGPWLWPLASVPMRLAGRLSGYVPEVLCYPVARPPSLSALMTFRTEFLDAAFQGSLDTVEQIVILGAGWDTRAYDLPKDSTHRVFEVDAPATSDAKRAAIAKSGIDASHVTFVSADFNRQSWLDALNDHGFDPGLPTFILWEGVSMYLEDQAVDATLQSVAEIADGSAIAFDYLSSELLHGEPPFRLLGPYMKYGILALYSERFAFGLPMQTDARGAAARFVEDRGLELKSFDAIGFKRAPLYGFVLAERHEVH